MVASSVSMAIASMWASMAAWFTPTVLFCAANLIIATIFIASNSSNNNNRDHFHGDSLTRISRVSSFLHRARSINSSSYSATITTVQSQHQPKYTSFSRLAQSIHFSSNDLSSSGDESELEIQPLSHAPSLFERVKSLKFSSVYNENAFPAKSDNSPVLDRPPSFFDRVKSFRISSAFDLGATSTQPETLDTDPSHDPGHHVIRSKSDKTSRKKSLVEMKKSRSEMRIAPSDDEDVELRRPATARDHEVDEEVDARAEDFINRFKQQLKLQRLESLVRYKEMLNRRRQN